MKKDCIQSALLVGAGSIGKRHLEIISERFHSIVVIDPDIEIYKYLSKMPYFDRVEYLSKLPQLKNLSRIDLAVISNWGPDHYEVFTKLAESGIKNFIIEKPLADSFYELNQMKQLMESMKLNVRTNLGILYSEIPKKLFEFEKTYKIGTPRSIIVYGGAKCIATIGIHYVALANYLFKNRPSAVSAVLRSHEINPRNKSLVYLEGSAQWIYPNDQYLSLNFSNTSQIDPKCIILYSNAEISIYNQTLVLKKISNKDLQTLNKPTKTASASETILEISINTHEDIMSSINNVFDSLARTEVSIESQWGFAATYDLLSALVSSELQRVIKLPIENDSLEFLYQKKWRIS